ncbi:acyl-CoA dehydratase activase-related protein [Desulfobacula sp.]|uniref:acyl-CoA dehydratase activase-related protein n=1 Tax=Desulfobacula sp. TaxID=2593537 RepID=UPI002625CBAF|nr:acyl-CoA dehydratase activase-related protein [Desulfobacula sp.]
MSRPRPENFSDQHHTTRVLPFSGKKSLPTAVFRAGIDIGSTTSKIIIFGHDGSPLFMDYRRHDTRTKQSLIDGFHHILKALGDITICLTLTGSAGMGLSELFGIPFIQEVVASAELAQVHYPDVRTLIDIGGEDSKLIFFDGHGRSDIRMNGNCAGGTGAFIDQMAVLLGVPFEEFNGLAEHYQCIHPIASRCGVFAKTDVQALMSRGVSGRDIAASVFNAVAVQTLTTLCRGFKPGPKILFTGGPLTFMPMLRDILAEKMTLNKSDIVVPPHPELFPAMGAAMASETNTFERSISQLLALMSEDHPVCSPDNKSDGGLFADAHEFEEWMQTRFTPVDRIDLTDLDGRDAFVGIDTGSTTTKMVLVDREGRMALSYYAYNKGDHIVSVKKGLNYFADMIRQQDIDVHVRATAVTGYGEDLIKTAFKLDLGIVETLAHVMAARHVARDTSFILDIGGQDMKAMFVDHGGVYKIEINEACSSGCGTFLQTFAEILNRSVESFSALACTAVSPCDLGSRCTVFMNSRVKQFLREGAELKDIAAGLAYSVVRNCLNKVLKIKNFNDLGDNIVVQGGTFLNPSVHRAFEKLTGKKVYCPDIAGLMGAFGSALAGRDYFYKEKLPCSSPINLAQFGQEGNYKKTFIQCKGCSNHCVVSKLQFDDSRVFYTGNRCERKFSNGGKNAEKGFNFADYEADLIFNRTLKPAGAPRLCIGIPRVLNMFENFPFWCTLFVETGMEVKLSSQSNAGLYEKGVDTVMSDSICFPAKLVHGHIIELMEKDIDRVFYPMVVYERDENQGANTYNCPIVTGYPAVIKSAIDPEGGYGIPFDIPPLNLKDRHLFKKSCRQYFKQLGIGNRQFSTAFSKAMTAYMDFRQTIKDKAAEVMAKASRENRQVVVIAGRPYHLDRFINHGAVEMLSKMGIDVISAGSIPTVADGKNDQVLTQWAYTNRMYNAGKYTAAHPTMEMVQLNSFGCGLDAIATDELTEILKHSGKNLTVVRIDEIASPGSIQLRLRTLVETMKIRRNNTRKHDHARKQLPLFTHQDRNKKILVPFFSKLYSPFVKSISESTGYHFEVLPPSDKQSLELGLKYTNNEICYPAIIIVGDILKALESGKYDVSDVAVGITQTGAQCRASNYVALIKKALLAAGYDVPVITVHLKTTNLNDQPGFNFSKLALLKKGLYSIAFADALLMMCYPLLVREKIKGSAWRLVEHYTDLWHSSGGNDPDKTLCLLKKAVTDFNTLPLNPGPFPRIGIVGEIYAKYNDFCNHNVVGWLTENGVEIELPCLINFFTQGFVNFKVDRKTNIEKKSILWPLSVLLERHADKYIRQVDHILKQHRFYKPVTTINDLAENAAQVVDLSIQFGEGWLIPGEVIKMAQDGIENILCLQPFGCIANQVIAKGIEKKLKDLYPNLNILFIDLDANTSEANLFNRLHFLVKNARVSLELDTKNNRIVSV